MDIIVDYVFNKICLWTYYKIEHMPTINEKRILLENVLNCSFLYV